MLRRSPPRDPLRLSGSLTDRPRARGKGKARGKGRVAGAVRNNPKHLRRPHRQFTWVDRPYLLRKAHTCAPYSSPRRLRHWSSFSPPSSWRRSNRLPPRHCPARQEKRDGQGRAVGGARSGVRQQRLPVDAGAEGCRGQPVPGGRRERPVRRNGKRLRRDRAGTRRSRAGIRRPRRKSFHALARAPVRLLYEEQRAQQPHRVRRARAGARARDADEVEAGVYSLVLPEELSARRHRRERRRPDRARRATLCAGGLFRDGHGARAPPAAQETDQALTARGRAGPRRRIL